MARGDPRLVKAENHPHPGEHQHKIRTPTKIAPINSKYLETLDPSASDHNTLKTKFEKSFRLNNKILLNPSKGTILLFPRGLKSLVVDFRMSCV